MKFSKKLEQAQNKNNSLLCLGLDPEFGKLPSYLQKIKEPFFTFNKAIIDATFDLVCAYKPNMAFYEAVGVSGFKQLENTIIYLKEKHPELPIILDGKRGDIGNTARLYAQMAFAYFGVDALTVNPYLGLDSLEPYLEYRDKFIFVLAKTSNPGSCDFQDLKINGKPLYGKVAEKLKTLNKRVQIGVVVSATYPVELRIIRKLLPNYIFLIPGIGSQGGDLEKTMKYGLDKEKRGVVINVSRSVIYAKDIRKEAQKIRKQINFYVK